MKRKEVTAKKSQYYGRDLKAGDKFMLEEDLVLIFTMEGLIEDPLGSIPAEVKNPPDSKRNYNRRDMKARP